MRYQREAPQLPPFPIQLPLFCWVLRPGHQWQQKGLYTSCETESSWIYIFSSRLHRLPKCSELHGGFDEIHNQQMLWKVCLNPLSLKRKASKYPQVKLRGTFFPQILLLLKFSNWCWGKTEGQLAYTTEGHRCEEQGMIFVLLTEGIWELHEEVLCIHFFLETGYFNRR